MDQTSRDIFFNLLAESHGAVEVVIINSEEAFMMMVEGIFDQRAHVISAASVNVIKLIKKQDENSPICLTCEFRFAPNDAGAPAYMVVLVPFAKHDCAIACGVCNRCARAAKDFAGLEEHIKKTITDLVPSSHFITVPHSGRLN